MKIKLTTVYVDDHEKALRFYTEVPGFTRKTDFSQGPYRWLQWPQPRSRTAPNCTSSATTTRRPKPSSRRSSSRDSLRRCFTRTTSSATTTG